MYKPYKVTPDGISAVAPLFLGWDETPIWSCLQGTMGEIYAVKGDNGALLAQAVLADFCFFAGDVLLAGRAAAAALVGNDLRYTRSSMLLVPQNADWSDVIEGVCAGRFRREARYAFDKDTQFDPVRLRGFLDAVPPGFEIVPVSRELYWRSLSSGWSRDLCSQYASWEDYSRYALGFMALHGGEPVAGASTYSHYDGGIEIEIDTRRDFRRRGLAAACASALILECLARGLYPSWDAANAVSVALAQKLGYRFSHEYPVYIVDASGRN